MPTRWHNSRMSEHAPRSRTFLFIGDSVTAGRREEDPEDLGFGYVRLIAEHVAAHEPASRVVNRGCGGDRVRDLAARFTADCLDLDPDVVTIAVGVNDTWRRFDQNELTDDDDFEADYRYLLDQLSATRPAAPVLLVVPFVTDVDAERAAFHADLDPKVHRLRSLAHEFGATLVDAEKTMHDALADGHTPQTLAPDGIHPTVAGHRLIADAWLDAFRDEEHHQHHHRE